jgi:hypothetical protein
MKDGGDILERRVVGAFVVAVVELVELREQDPARDRHQEDGVLDQ